MSEKFIQTSRGDIIFVHPESDGRLTLNVQNLTDTAEGVSLSIIGVMKVVELLLEHVNECDQTYLRSIVMSEKDPL